MTARSVVTLREPDETVVVEDGAAWVGFRLAVGHLTLLGERAGHLLSVPFWRVVSIESEDGTIDEGANAPR